MYIFSHLKEESESHPLIIRHISSLVLLVVSAGHHSRVGYVSTNVEGEGSGYGVPVEHFLDYR